MKKDPKYARRLLKLAAFLEKLPPERFSLLRWVGNDWKGKADLSCGTVACSLGWATTIPEFRKLGLKLRKTFDGPTVTLLRRIHPNADAHDAAHRVFGLTSSETEVLFYGSQDDGRIDWSASSAEAAAHIRAFVKRETGRV